MVQFDEWDVEAVKVELFLTTSASIVLKETRGVRSRVSFAAWEKTFTEYFGVRPNERMAYKVTLKDKKTNKLYSVVLVFSGNALKLGHGVINGELVCTAPED